MKNVALFIGLLGMFGVAICMIGLIVSFLHKKPKKKWAKWFLISFAALCVVGFILDESGGGKTNTQNVVVANNSGDIDSQPAEEVEESSKVYPDEFVSACGAIGMDTAKIKKWTQIEDWVNGDRYTFSYKSHHFVVYFNYDGTVSSIKLGSGIGTDIYRRGYVPYNVEDYLVDVNTADNLIPYAEELVRPTLNYPNTADFPLFGWSYGRNKNLYQLSNTVKAKNGFGVEDEISFTVIFDMDADGKCVYLEVGGNVVKNELPAEPEREQVPVEETAVEVPDGSFRLADGVLGEYGQPDPNYPEYIDYYLPDGRFTVSNNAKNSIVMIIDNSTNDEVSRVTLTEGQSGEFEINASQHIELTIYSDVTLTQIQ